MDSRGIAERIFQHAVQAVHPYATVKGYLEGNRNRWSDRGVHVVSFGKAASQMTRACEDVLKGLVKGGHVLTKYGHGEELKSLPLHEAGHPVPDEKGMSITKTIIEYVSALTGDDELLCLISGGGSALFCCPFEGVSLSEKQKTTDLLLKAGADIFELNTVRKHISGVKGGRFLKFFHGSRLTSLILSDVMGDRLDVIASGPTTNDESSFADALGVIEKYGLEKSVPVNVMGILKKGADGLVPETLKKGDEILEKVENIIIGSLDVAIRTAEQKARESGFEVQVSSEYVSGEAQEAGRNIARRVKRLMRKERTKQLCLISGGETTVTVKGKGKGGRNMELGLSFALEMDGVEGVTMLSAGTDGNDGPTDAAGAFVDGHTIKRAQTLGLNVHEFLDNNDSYHYFKKEGGLFVPGPTGTNVMDIQIVIIE